MSARKQQLLKRHRQRKRLVLLGALVILALFGIFVAWWPLPLFLLLGWIAHEAWFADHLFYAPGDDYCYDFPSGTAQFPVTLHEGGVQVTGDFSGAETLVLQLRIKANWLGRLFDPHVWVGEDRQDLERGVDGERFLNLSGQGLSLIHISEPTRPY